MKNKNGELLVENVVFIILNLVFLTILILFLLRQGTGAAFMEEAYSKQIALLIDSAKPGMVMEINLEKGLGLAKKEGIDFKDVVTINGNYVLVKLAEKGGHKYHFFNDVSVQAYPKPAEEGGYSGIYVLTVSKNAQQ